MESTCNQYSLIRRSGRDGSRMQQWKQYDTVDRLRVSPGALSRWSCSANCLKLEPHNLAWSLASGHR